MAMKFIHSIIAFSLCASVASAVSCAADDKTCAVEDATSLIQKNMVVASGAPAPAPAAEPEFPSDMGMLHLVLEDTFNHMNEVQSRNLKARAGRADGCEVGDTGKKDPTTGLMTCKCATDPTNSVFSSTGLPAAGKGKSLLQMQHGRARSVMFTWEDHNDLPLHKRLRWERQRRGLPKSSIQDLTTITDSKGMRLDSSEEETSLIQEQFPLAVQLHLDEPAQCQTNAQGQMQPKQDVKDGAAVSIDVSAMLTCQATHAAQLVDDMNKELPGETKKWTAAQADFKKANKANDDFKDKLLKACQLNATKLEASLNDAYPCGPGIQAKSFFTKLVGKTDADVEHCISLRKVQSQKNSDENAKNTAAALAQVGSKKTVAHDALDEAKEAFDLFKKQLRDAKTQKYMIPAVADMTSDKVMGPLTKIDSIMGANVAGPNQAAAAIQGEAGKKDANSIYDADAKTFYLTQQISGMISPPLNFAFTQGLNVVWDAINIAKEAVETGLLTLIGSIPFVGGALAAVVSVVFDAIWTLMVNAINAALVGLFDGVVNKMISAMVAPLMKDLSDPKAKADPKAVVAAATKAKTDMTSAASKAIAAKAKAASAAAASSKSGTTTFMKQMSDDAKDDHSQKDAALQDQYSSSKSFLLQVKAQIGKRIGKVE
jgi:hypothetical protein